MPEEINRALEQAMAQAASIERMVAALDCDYDRLEELRDEREGSSFPSRVLAERESGHPADKTEGWWEDEFPDEAEELAELEAAAGDCSDEDEARQCIDEDPLSVEVRGGWHTPGDESGDQATEFQILLCTGGPAVRIVGELDRGEPHRAWIEYQDWFTAWQEASGLIDSSTLLRYCSVFWFGE